MTACMENIVTTPGLEDELIRLFMEQAKQLGKPITFFHNYADYQREKPRYFEDGKYLLLVDGKKHVLDIHSVIYFLFRDGTQEVQRNAVNLYQAMGN
ncbi:hypothetical protein JW711_02375 [Candidatus Woesearchaeota archaeon]|nr:hypothetical protein [Candidatus Woesearchaeota archaeon]